MSAVVKVGARQRMNVQRQDASHHGTSDVCHRTLPVYCLSDSFLFEHFGKTGLWHDRHAALRDFEGIRCLGKQERFRWTSHLSELLGRGFISLNLSPSYFRG